MVKEQEQALVGATNAATIMSKALRDGPEQVFTRPDSPSFTCEVCKISVRSAQKLLDHVNFSPLHRAALEGNRDDRGFGSVSKAHQRRILYDGSKLFWRINETLEICIYEDVGANTVTVTAFQQQQSTEKISPVVLELRSLAKALEDPKHHHIQMKDGGGGGASHAAENITKYILARLHARKDAHGHIALHVQKHPDEDFEPTIVASHAVATHHHSFNTHNHHGLPTDLAVRRRHTIDDVKEAQKGVTDAAVELKLARVKAETLSNLARISLEAFSTHGKPEFSRKKSEWLRAYNRVTLQKAVEHNKDFLHSHPGADRSHF
ncbi:TPA: hypothetical protein N0F65_002406 [Lagenidium giganteum]|uniref:Uncharacterized protein n=1 Tax=Lagenidium giganteum TaxID=4803 RepID=A0AAV2YN71_9STRA|nr:TPA: hypothetical protein N0F65_002406 [Lagenidium giganteum]